MKILGIAGRAGSGKDELAKTLVSEFGFKQIAFAGPLYKEVSEAFKIDLTVLSERATKESPKAELALCHCLDVNFVRLILGDSPSAKELTAPRSPRFVMQKWGTEYRRAQDLNYWINQFIAVVEAGNGDQDFVVTDVRFDNEAEVLVGLGGVVVWVDRDVESVISHASENGLSQNYISDVIKNDGSLEDLKRKSRGLFYQYESLMSDEAVSAELVNNKNVRL